MHSYLEMISTLFLDNDFFTIRLVSQFADSKIISCGKFTLYNVRYFIFMKKKRHFKVKKILFNGRFLISNEKITIMNGKYLLFNGKN